jgi:hypothetical protein
MLKIGLGIFLIAHGLVHSILAVAPNPGDADAKPGAFFIVLRLGTAAQYTEKKSVIEPFSMLQSTLCK